MLSGEFCFMGIPHYPAASWHVGVRHRTWRQHLLVMENGVAAVGLLDRILKRVKTPETPTPPPLPPVTRDASAHYPSPPLPRVQRVAGGSPSFGRGFAVVDVETTGLSPRSDRIIELAVVRLDIAGRVVDEWSTRLNPQRSVGATWVHGISDADVARAPRFGDVAEEVTRRLNGAVFVGHNARFDAGFVLAELVRAGWDVPEPTVWCTQAASHHWLPTATSRRLTDVTTAAGITLTNAHSALGDARATAALIAHFFDASTGFDRLDDLATAAAALPWPTSATLPALGPISVEIPPLTIYPRRPARETKTVPAKLRTYRLPTDALDDLPNAVHAYALDLTASFPDVSDELRTKLATKHGLEPVDVLGAHERLLSALADHVVADGRVTATEQGDLDDFADTLGLPVEAASNAIATASENRVQRLSAKVRPLPATWQHGEPLRIGDAIVFTGDFPGRATLTSKAEAAGLRVIGTVSRKTAALVSDGEFIGGKANRATELGTRVVTPADFQVLLRYIQHSPAPAPPPAAKTRPTVAAPQPVVASTLTGPQEDPAAIRSWARENGHTVSDRGRLSAVVVAAYRAAHAKPEEAVSTAEGTAWRGSDTTGGSALVH